MSDIDDFEFEEEEEQSSRVNRTPRQSPASAFWEEFKLVTRSYAESDECLVAKQRSLPSSFMELLFYYLSAVTGLSVTSETMNGKIILINTNNYTKTV
jgi:hypothetical protein